MVEHVWTVVCSRSVIDTSSNNITLQNVIEQLSIAGEPVPTGVVPISLEVVTLWARVDFDVPSRGRGRLTFVSPSGKTLEPHEYAIDLSTYHRTRVRSGFQALPVGEAGRHVFRVEFQNEGEAEWRQAAAIPLEVIFAPPATD